MSEEQSSALKREGRIDDTKLVGPEGGRIKFKNNQISKYLLTKVGL